MGRGGVGGGVGRMVHCNSYSVVSKTAPISKKQKKVGIKYLAKILWESSLVLLVQCSLAFSLYTT